MLTFVKPKCRLDKKDWRHKKETKVEVKKLNKPKVKKELSREDMVRQDRKRTPGRCCHQMMKHTAACYPWSP